MQPRVKSGVESGRVDALRVNKAKKILRRRYFLHPFDTPQAFQTRKIIAQDERF
jgi:hypothetical protein